MNTKMQKSSRHSVGENPPNSARTKTDPNNKKSIFSNNGKIAKKN